MTEKAAPAVVYSYSRLDSYKQCPRQYAYRYVEKPDVEKQPTIEAFLGTVCHETVQQIYKDLRVSKLMTLEETLAVYDDRWERLRPSNLRIVRDRYTEENYRETGRGYVKSFYETNRPFDDGKTIGIEKQVQIVLSGGYQFTGYIDRLVDHGGGHYEIIDYKTGSDLPGEKDLESNWQLPLYQIGLTQMFPDLEDVTCTWCFLAHNKKISVKRTPDHLKELEEKIIAVILKLQAIQEFEPRMSALCSWCDYESICPARKHQFAVERLSPEEFRRDDGVKLVDSYVKMKAELAEGKAKLDELESRIISYARKNSLRVVRGSQEKVTVWSKKGALQLPSKDKNPHATQAVVEILKRRGLWERFSYLSSFQVAKALEAGELPPDVAREIMPFTTREDVWRLYMAKLGEWA